MHSIDQQYLGFSTKPQEADAFLLPNDFDYEAYYELKLTYVKSEINKNTGNPYYRIIWSFVVPKFGDHKIYDDYYMSARQRLAKFENIYRNWGATKADNVEGKVVHAKLTKNIYNGNESFKIADIKEWVHMPAPQQPAAHPATLNDDIPF